MHFLEMGHTLGRADLSRRARLVMNSAYAVGTVLYFLFNSAYPPGLPASVVPPEFQWVRQLPIWWINIVGTVLIVVWFVALLNVPDRRRVTVTIPRHVKRAVRMFARPVRLANWLFAGTS
jgi:hypothetical protein